LKKGAIFLMHIRASYVAAEVLAQVYLSEFALIGGANQGHMDNFPQFLLLFLHNRAQSQLKPVPRVPPAIPSWLRSYSQSSISHAAFQV
jgi:hypothetical protein